MEEIDMHFFEEKERLMVDLYNSIAGVNQLIVEANQLIARMETLKQKEYKSLDKLLQTTDISQLQEFESKSPQP